MLTLHMQTYVWDNKLGVCSYNIRTGKLGSVGQLHWLGVIAVYVVIFSECYIWCMWLG